MLDELVEGEVNEKVEVAGVEAAGVPNVVVAGAGAPNVDGAGAALPPKLKVAGAGVDDDEPNPPKPVASAVTTHIMSDIVAETYTKEIPCRSH